MKFRAEPFKLIIEEQNSTYCIETINATSIFASIQLDELTEEQKKIVESIQKNQELLKVKQNDIEELYKKIKSYKEDSDIDVKNLKERTEEIKQILINSENLSRQAIKIAKKIIESTVKDFDKSKDIIYKIPNEKTQEFFYFLRCASLGVSTSETEIEKKTEDIIELIGENA